jgi:dienelactone hydrolase
MTLGASPGDSPGDSDIPSSFRWPAVVALLLLLSGCALGEMPNAPYGPDDVFIPPLAAPMARMPTDPIPATFKLPPGNGPFPAVIVLHGCGGRGPSQLSWADRLNGWGYAALIPDSMTPRGIKRVCEPDAQAYVTPRDRVGDVGSAIAWLRTKPTIEPNRIAVLGLSHGGATAVLSTDRQYAGFRLRAAIDYYGACLDPAAQGDVPLLVLAGDEDDWGHPATRCRLYESQLPPGAIFEIHTYPGVYHAFDNPSIPREVVDGHVLEYNAEAAEDSFARVHAFLDRWDK